MFDIDYIVSPNLTGDESDLVKSAMARAGFRRILETTLKELPPIVEAFSEKGIDFFKEYGENVADFESTLTSEIRHLSEVMTDA